MFFVLFEMYTLSGSCPKWLEQRINAAGGIISFHNYMEIALNDPDHGAYAKGHLRIGREGDFVTSPSLGSDFAQLLSVQIIDWLHQLDQLNVQGLPLSFVDIGPGEGDLVIDLISAIDAASPELLSKLQFILVEVNEGMERKQRRKLKDVKKIPIYWRTLEELSLNPVYGILFAHEILDALPVERIVYFKEKLYRQGIKLIKDKDKSTIVSTTLPLTQCISNSINDIANELQLEIPLDELSDGWNSEWHIELFPWFKKVFNSLIQGPLLIIDYALEFRRYYNNKRNSGTIIGYKEQNVTSNILNDVGYMDITSHLCIETLYNFAIKSGWHLIGECRQGQALLSLGLAQRLHSLQHLPSNELKIALERREALLRLVDPTTLGDFRWIAFQKNNTFNDNLNLRNLFLEEPIV